MSRPQSQEYYNFLNEIFRKTREDRDKILTKNINTHNPIRQKSSCYNVWSKCLRKNIAWEYENRAKYRSKRPENNFSVCIQSHDTMKDYLDEENVHLHTVTVDTKRVINRWQQEENVKKPKPVSIKTDPTFGWLKNSTNMKFILSQDEDKEGNPFKSSKKVFHDDHKTFESIFSKANAKVHDDKYMYWPYKYEKMHRDTVSDWIQGGQQD